jgi:hypothetical protein
LIWKYKTVTEVQIEEPMPRTGEGDIAVELSEEGAQIEIIFLTKKL